MEEDAKSIKSPVLKRSEVVRQLETLDKAVDEAQKRIDYMVAHDEEIAKAIDIVERFLRKRRRVCYGGQAINSLLPRSQQFYDTRYTIPDYDFFTPTMEEDVDILVADLKKAGFMDVVKKVGIHDGTTKVMVNYIPVADCSAMNPRIFTIIQRRAKMVDGILYCDPDFLRMLMYLELSRPRGQVERWHKVYERLTLLNAAYPVTGCDDAIQVNSSVNYEDRRVLLDFCQRHHRVLLGAEVVELMEKDTVRTSMDQLVKRGGPVVFMSPQADLDAEDLKEILSQQEGGIRLTVQKSEWDNLFDVIIMKRRGKPIALIVKETSCHAYALLHIEGGEDLRIGTPDLLLQLYYSFMLFGRKEKAYFQTALECLIKKLHTLLRSLRNRPTSLLPSFGVRCSGRQKGFATLLKERQERTEAEQKKVKKGGTRRVQQRRGRRHRVTRRQA